MKHWAGAYPVPGGVSITSIAYAGPPTSGTYQQFAIVVDANNATWICVVAGTPGQWIPSSGKPTVDWPPPNNCKYNYEFNRSSSTLPPGWSPYPSAGAIASYTEGQGEGAIAGYTHAGTSLAGIVYPFSSLPAGWRTITAKIVGTGVGPFWNKCGLMLTDGTTTGWSCAVQQLIAQTNAGGIGGPAGMNIAQVMDIDQYKTPSAFNNGFGSVDTIMNPARYLQWWLSTTPVASNHFTPRWSADGVNFAQPPGVAGPIALGFTPAAFGIMTDNENGAESMVAVEWVRVQ